MNLTVLSTSREGIMPCLYCCERLISRSVMSSAFVHCVAAVRMSFLLKAAWYPVACKYRMFFLCSSIDRHLGLRAQFHQWSLRGRDWCLGQNSIVIQMTLVWNSYKSQMDNLHQSLSQNVFTKCHKWFLSLFKIWGVGWINNNGKHTIKNIGMSFL